MNTKQAITLIKEVLEERGYVLEAKVEEPQLQEAIREFAKLSNEIDKAANSLKKMKEKYSDLEDVLRPLLEELATTKDKALEVDDILVTIKKKGYERTSVAYKEAYEWLHGRVNAAMKAMVEESLEQTKKVSKIAASIGVQKLDENKLFSAVRQGLKSLFSKIKSGNTKLGGYIDAFKSKLK